MEKQVVKYKGNIACTLDELISSYKELNNVWKVGERFGVAGQIVHSYLKKAGVINKMRYFTAKEFDFLKENYKSYRDIGKLKELAKIMGRTDAFLSRKAKMLGLTDPNNHISMKFMSKIVSERTKKYISDNGHPKGMLGKKHTEEFKKGASERSKKMWQDPNSKVNSEELKQKQSDRMSKFMRKRLKENSVNNYNRVKRGMVKIGGKTFFARSSWECNIGAYLEFLKSKGEIKEWEHEVETFWFEKIKRGVRSYLPDFKVTNKDGSTYFLEVKGWMDKKSITKIKRMKLYYPQIRLEVIDQDVYKDIKRWSSVIKDWGLLDSDEYLASIKLCSIEGCDSKNFSNNLCKQHFNEFRRKKKKLNKICLLC